MQDALCQAAYGLSASHRDLHDKYDRLFDQIVREADDGQPEPAKGFDAIFAAWNTNRKQQQDVDNDEAERLDEQEQVLLDTIITTPASSAGEIGAKVSVAKELIEQIGSRWTDARDVKMLDSVMEDLTRLCANDKGQP